MTLIQTIGEAQTLLNQGKVIAYPTEGVYGLGCDPFQEKAVLSLLRLKQRPVKQGLILLIANWPQLEPLVDHLSDVERQQLQNTWPGFVTWVLPKSKNIPPWISGEHHTIAIRMTTHPIARALCSEHPIVSTSANLSGQASAKNIAEIEQQFPHGLAGIMLGDLGSEEKSSPIFGLEGVVLRA